MWSWTHLENAECRLCGEALLLHIFGNHGQGHNTVGQVLLEGLLLTATLSRWQNTDTPIDVQNFFFFAMSALSIPLPPFSKARVLEPIIYVLNLAGKGRSERKGVPAVHAFKLEGEAAGQLPAGLAHGHHAGAGRARAVEAQRHPRLRPVLRLQPLPHRHRRHLCAAPSPSSTEVWAMVFCPLRSRSCSAL